MPRFNTFHLTDAYYKRIAKISHVEIPAGANQGADLSQWCGPVFNQQQEGSCTACSCRDYLLWLQNKYGYSAQTTPPYTDPSVNAIYYYARLLCGDLTVDEGSSEYNAMLAAVKYGVSLHRMTHMVKTLCLLHRHFRTWFSRLLKHEIY